MALRPSRGNLLQISISENEAEDWATDPRARERALRDFARMAREKGRRFLEVRGARGEQLVVQEVAL